MRRRLTLTIALVALSLGACTFDLASPQKGRGDLPDAGGPLADAPYGNEASRNDDDARLPDGTTDSTAPETGSGSGDAGNLLPSGSFEVSGVSQCGGAGWGTYQGTLDRSTDEHRSGSASCHACGTDEFSVDSPAVGAAKSGESYLVSGWVENLSTVSVEAQMTIRFWDNEHGSLGYSSKKSVILAPGAPWQQIVHDDTVPPDAPANWVVDGFVFVVVPNQKSACVFVDDVEIHKE